MLSEGSVHSNMPRLKDSKVGAAEILNEAND